MSITTGLGREEVGRNEILNGNFDLWARGTSFVYTALYSADRWGHHQFQVGVSTRQTFVAGGEHPGNSQYVMRVSGNSVNGVRMQVAQGIEHLNTIPLRGKRVTLSYYLRCSAASFSVNPTAVRGYVGYTTGTADAVFNTNNYLVTSANATATQGSLPTTWKKYTVSLNIPTNANNVAVVFQTDLDPVFLTSDWYEISQVKLEVGSVATPFSLAGGSIGGEITLCERYYQTITHQLWGDGYSAGAGAYVVLASGSFRTTMRTTPSVTAPTWALSLVNTPTLDSYTTTGITFAAISNGTGRMTLRSSSAIIAEAEL
jgi:hypothetical protein